AGGIVRERGRERARRRQSRLLRRGQGAARPGKGRCARAHRVRVSEIDVGEGDGAAGIEIATVVDVGVLGHRAGLGDGGDHRRLVAAGDGDSDVLGGEAAVVVGDLDRVGLGQRLARRQGVLDLVGNRDVPDSGPGLSFGAVLRDGFALYPYTTLFRSCGGAHRVRVKEIDIGEGDGAADIEIAAVVDV